MRLITDIEKWIKCNFLIKIASKGFQVWQTLWIDMTSLTQTFHFFCDTLFFLVLHWKLSGLTKLEVFYWTTWWPLIMMNSIKWYKNIFLEAHEIRKSEFNQMCIFLYLPENQFIIDLELTFFFSSNSFWFSFRSCFFLCFRILFFHQIFLVPVK